MSDEQDLLEHIDRSSAKLPLMDAVMDLQFCLQAMIKTGSNPLSNKRVGYLLSDEFSSEVGEAEIAKQIGT